MKKLGAVREGVLRADRITWTGHVRDTVLFAILKDECEPVHLARLQMFTGIRYRSACRPRSTAIEESHFRSLQR